MAQSGAQLNTLDRGAVVERFTHMRRRTRELFAMLDPSLYYERPIALRNPVVFYEGHIPAFAVNTLIRRRSAAKVSTSISRPSSRAYRSRVRSDGGGPRQSGVALARDRRAVRR